MQVGRRHNGLEVGKSTPTLFLVWGQMRKKKNPLKGGVLPGEEGFSEGQELEGGFRATEHMGS